MVAWIKLIEVKVLKWLHSRDILKVVAARFVGNLVYVRCEEKRETKIFFYLEQLRRRIVINWDGEDYRRSRFWGEDEDFVLDMLSKKSKSDKQLNIWVK